jgi:hypothetical protein
MSTQSTQQSQQEQPRERRRQPSRQHAKKDALTFTRLQEHQDAFLSWLTSPNTVTEGYQFIR